MLFLEALNRPADAYKRQSSKMSWLLVALTIIIVTVFDPILGYVAGYRSISVFRITIMAAIGVITYLVICTVFWIVCRAFGSSTPLSAYIRSWGISYIPTALCAVIVGITENFFFIFWNSMIWGMIFSIIFFGILIWKTVLYVIFLKEVGQLKRGKLAGAFIICGVAILALAMMDARIGLKTPVL